MREAERKVGRRGGAYWLICGISATWCAKDFLDLWAAILIVGLAVQRAQLGIGGASKQAGPPIHKPGPKSPKPRSSLTLKQQRLLFLYRRASWNPMDKGASIPCNRSLRGFYVPWSFLHGPSDFWASHVAVSQGSRELALRHDSSMMVCVR